MIITRTPFRISFCGGGTDIPNFYKKNSYGLVLASSINKFLYVAVKSHSSIYKEKIRLNYSSTELVNNIDDVKNPIIKACLKFTNVNERVYISTVADVPGGTGLGSSSTFCVGLLNALYNFKGEVVSKNRLAEEAAHIEIEILKRPVGKQDHYAAAFGGINLFKFYSNGSVSINPINDNSKFTKMIFNNLHTFYTGISRSSSKVLEVQRERVLINTMNLKFLRNQANTLYKLNCNNKLTLNKLGKILDEGWKIKKKLSKNISSKLINDYYNTAKKKGALGGKLSGAGGGGFLSFIIPAQKKKKLIKALMKKKLTYFPVNLDSSGSIILIKS